MKERVCLASAQMVPLKGGIHSSYCITPVPNNTIILYILQ